MFNYEHVPVTSYQNKKEFDCPDETETNLSLVKTSAPYISRIEPKQDCPKLKITEKDQFKYPKETKKTLSVNWMTSPDTRNQKLDQNSVFNYGNTSRTPYYQNDSINLEQSRKLFDSYQKQPYATSWPAQKLPPILETSQIPPSTLPMLTGDLALSTEKNKTYNESFLSVSQLVDNKCNKQRKSAPTVRPTTKVQPKRDLPKIEEEHANWNKQKVFKTYPDDKQGSNEWLRSGNVSQRSMPGYKPSTGYVEVQRHPKLVDSQVTVKSSRIDRTQMHPFMLTTAYDSNSTRPSTANWDCKPGKYLFTHLTF